jgi:hypothetical protein
MPLSAPAQLIKSELALRTRIKKTLIEFPSCIRGVQVETGASRQLKTRCRLYHQLVALPTMLGKESLGARHEIHAVQVRWSPRN